MTSLAPKRSIARTFKTAPVFGLLRWDAAEILRRPSCRKGDLRSGGDGALVCACRGATFLTDHEPGSPR